VGFRYTCQLLARDYQVAGHVRNLADGRVEMVVEGEPIELDKFVEAIRVEMSRYVSDVQVETEPGASEAPVGFTVRH